MQSRNTWIFYGGRPRSRTPILSERRYSKPVGVPSRPDLPHVEHGQRVELCTSGLQSDCSPFACRAHPGWPPGIRTQRMTRILSAPRLPFRQRPRIVVAPERLELSLPKEPVSKTGASAIPPRGYGEWGWIRTTVDVSLSLYRRTQSAGLCHPLKIKLSKILGGSGAIRTRIRRSAWQVSNLLGYRYPTLPRVGLQTITEEG